MCLVLIDVALLKALNLLLKIIQTACRVPMHFGIKLMSINLARAHLALGAVIIYCHSYNNLRISESHSVYIDVVELDLNVMERRQTVVVKNVTYFNMRGTRIQCRICPENTGLLNIQVINLIVLLMRSFSLEISRIFTY